VIKREAGAFAANIESSGPGATKPARPNPLGAPFYGCRAPPLLPPPSPPAHSRQNSTGRWAGPGERWGEGGGETSRGNLGTRDFRIADSPRRCAPLIRFSLREGVPSSLRLRNQPPSSDNIQPPSSRRTCRPRGERVEKAGNFPRAAINYTRRRPLNGRNTKPESGENHSGHLIAMFSFPDAPLGLSKQ
jgi:hypothetical protein